MHALPHIPATDIDDLPIKPIIFVIALIIWGISSLAKVAKKGTQQQKDRLRQVREAMERAQQMARQQANQAPARQPAALAPGIARRVPAPIRPPQKRAAQRARVAVPTGRRPATNYNVMTKKVARPAQSPTAVPTSQTAPNAPAQTKFATESPAPAPISTPRKATTVAAVAINNWLKHAAIWQQFILTELFQPPLALRADNPR